MGYGEEPMSGHNDRQWKKHFAWWPVKVHGEWVWLKTVYRRTSKLRIYGDMRIRWSWEYGNLFDVLSG